VALLNFLSFQNEPAKSPTQPITHCLTMKSKEHSSPPDNKVMGFFTNTKDVFANGNTELGKWSLVTSMLNFIKYYRFFAG
jgi:hypothetical protein